MAETKLEYITLSALPVDIDFSGTEEDKEKLPTFKMVAYTGSAVYSGVSRYPVIIDLKGLKIPIQNIPARMQHDANKGVGHTTKIEIKNGKVLMEGVISRDTEWAHDVITSAKNKFPWRVSIGFQIEEYQYVDDGETTDVNDRKFKGVGYVLRKTILKETSFVDVGADNNTNAIIKFSGENPFLTFNQTELIMATENKKTNDVSLSGNETKSEPEKTNTEGKFSGENVTNHQHTEPTQTTPVVNVHFSGNPSNSATFSLDQQQANLAENRRIAAIAHFGAGRLPDLETQAIADGWTVEKFKGEINAKLMPQGDQIKLSGDNNNVQLSASCLEVLALRAAGFSASEKQYEPKTLELADQYNGLGIQEFIQLAAPNVSLPKFQRESHKWMQLAFSSVSLPQILSNVANKTLLEGFNNVDETWKKLVAFGNVNNFYKHHRYRMMSNFTFERVSPDGEIKHGKLGEEHFEQEIDTFAIMFSLTRKMIINDDLGAFMDIPKNMGMGAGLAINDALWQTFLNGKTIDNKLFFSSDHGNILASTALDVAGLSAAEEYFLTQEQPKVDKKDKSRPLGIPAKYLIVPTALKVAAEILMKSAVLDGITQLGGNVNPHSGKFEVVSSPYLQSLNYTGYSSSNWYLMADPNRLPGFEVAFLSGKQHPTIESADADFNTMGIQFRGLIDFGVSAQDSRAALKLIPSA
ncbi:MAG: Mu-like prophage major head subunit gpT family protein [Planctomycetaceae bacterium]|jgi:hypothetical protein|nr:Mu-like prophage major head subunit gpT family protein [Planctomycetaceae bacterium]